MKSPIEVASYNCIRFHCIRDGAY